MTRFLMVLAGLVALVVAYFYAALSWSYSSGERAGWVQKLARKGWICKTWEGELALVSQPGAAVEKFYFTVRDDAVAAALSHDMGRRVSVNYEEKVGLPTSCFGDTRNYVTGVEVTPDIPLATGVAVSSGASATPGASAPPAASAAQP